MTYPDGSSLAGNWVDNKLEGKAEFTTAEKMVVVRVYKDGEL